MVNLRSVASGYGHILDRQLILAGFVYEQSKFIQAYTGNQAKAEAEFESIGKIETIDILVCSSQHRSVDLDGSLRPGGLLLWIGDATQC